MPRIPESEIERIKRETDLLALVRSRGIELEKHGSKDWRGLCPFHDDKKKPNFVVSPAKGLWRCWMCGKAGNPIQFVQHHDGISFRHAFELLDQGSAAAYAARSQISRCTVPVLPCPLDPEADDATLLQQVTTYYQERLKAAPPARAYLGSRGLDSDDLISRYQLGFADRSLGLRLPNINRKAGALLRTRLTQLGVWRKSGHEHFSGCIVVPLFDATGKIVSYYGRRIGRGAIDHLYSPGPHRGLFNPSAFDQEEVILCEAVLDALTFCASGITNVSCLYGTEGWTDELTTALKKVRRVRLAYDGDLAGDRAAERDVKRLQALGIDVYRIKFPWGMDANEYARKVTPAAKSLSLIVNAAVWCGQGKAPAPPAPVVEPKPPRDKEPWEKVPVEIAAPLAKELGQELKGVAHDVDEDTGEHLPCVSNVSLKTGQGWTQEPYWPAPLKEVEAQQEQLRQMAEERGLVPVVPAPAPSSLAASVSSLEEATKKENAAAPISAPTLEQRGEGAGARHSCGGQLEQRGEAWFLVIENREYRVTGLEKTVASDGLKIGLRVQTGERFHLDQIDLIRDAERRRFIERAAEETGLTADLLKRDMGRLLLAVEQAQVQLMKPAEAVATVVTLSPEEREEALQWLRAPNLITRLKEAFHLAGIIGEEANTLVAYLAGVSRKLERPLAIIIQSASAAGKSTLMDAVLSFFPEEDRIKYSAMTGQSLYYLGETNLQHKILAVVEEAGAEKASYALKLLQSEGELTIASTGKDPQTGRMVTQEYHVQGPVMIFLTTTAINLDEELQNRCLTLAVDETPAQTDRIHRLQRERRTLAGLIAREERKEVLAKLKNAQRLLQPVPVLNPYAPDLTFPSSQTRNRRDHEKYLTLIDAIALLHQHQRSRGQHVVGGRVVEHIAVTLEDIALANQLAPEVLGRSLDELPPQTRRLLEHIREIVTIKRKTESAKTASTFSRREVKDACGWSLTQVRVHLERLVELEYLGIRCGRMGGPFQYELLIEIDAPENIAHIGLIDVEKLRKNHAYAVEVAGQNGGVAGGGKTGPPPLKGYQEAA
jgi:DNA primase catalytic core